LLDLLLVVDGLGDERLIGTKCFGVDLLEWRGDNVLEEDILGEDILGEDILGRRGDNVTGEDISERLMVNFVCILLLI
jgi:hypothetical protein